MARRGAFRASLSPFGGGKLNLDDAYRVAEAPEPVAAPEPVEAAEPEPAAVAPPPPGAKKPGKPKAKKVVKKPIAKKIAKAVVKKPLAKKIPKPPLAARPGAVNYADKMRNAAPRTVPKPTVGSSPLRRRPGPPGLGRRTGSAGGGF